MDYKLGNPVGFGNRSFLLHAVTAHAFNTETVMLGFVPQSSK